MRANKLYDIYLKYDRIEDIPQEDREQLEQTIFRNTLDNVWESTRAFFSKRDPSQLEKAEKNLRYKMALIFRSYLGQASHWANKGDMDRKVDFQIWCGPAMGAFNEWVKGTYLEQPENRKVVPVGLNILHGALLMQRINVLRSQGVKISSQLSKIRPLEENALKKALGEEV